MMSYVYQSKLENQNLIENSQWKELLYKATKTRGVLIAELVYCLASVEENYPQDKRMTIGLSDELNKIIQNNEILEEIFKKIK